MSELRDDVRSINEEFKRLADITMQQHTYRVFFVHAPLGMAWMDESGTYTNVNNEFCRILRRLPSDVLGHNWREFTHPDDLETDSYRIQTRLAEAPQGGNYEADKQFIAPDGAKIYTHVWVMILYADPSGSKWAVIVQRKPDGTGS